jgi:hypothetical protein
VCLEDKLRFVGWALARLILTLYGEEEGRQAKQVAEKMPCSVILSEAKNLSSI